MNRFEPLFKEHERRYYKSQIVGDEEPLRRLFMTKAYHSQFALLSFYAKSNENTKKFLKNEFKIEGIDSVLFSFREPDWSKSKKVSFLSPLEHWFWGLDGMVRPFLKSLHKYSFSPLKTKDKVTLAPGKTKTLERCYLFLDSEESLLNMVKDLKETKDLSEENSDKDFFARLESAIFSGALDENEFDVQVNIKLSSGEIISFLELSEGERQMLTVIGLMRFTREDESLFLLDEPDTHLNPSWGINYFKHLNTYGFLPKNSQLLMTTHSPLMFASLEKEEVVLLYKNNENKIASKHPDNNPKGMGFSGILTSEMFGLRSDLDTETLQDLDNKVYLTTKKDLTQSERKKLNDINDRLDSYGFLNNYSDPYFQLFLNALNADKNIKNLVYNENSEDIEVKNKKVIEIMKKIRSKRK